MIHLAAESGVDLSIKNPRKSFDININGTFNYLDACRINNVKNLIGKGEPSFGEIPYRSGENMSLYADIQKAQNLLRWEPKYHLNSGLQKTISWYAEKG